MFVFPSSPFMGIFERKGGRGGGEEYGIFTFYYNPKISLSFRVLLSSFTQFFFSNFLFSFSFWSHRIALQLNSFHISVLNFFFSFYQLVNYLINVPPFFFFPSPRIIFHSFSSSNFATFLL